MTDTKRIEQLEHQIELLVESIEGINRVLAAHNDSLQSLNACIQLLGKVEGKLA